MRGIDHADPLQHHPHHAHLPRHPTQDTTTATRTTHQHTQQRRARQGQARATPPTTTGPEDMRHTHPTTRSHRSPPERPTARTQASTRTHGRQAVSGPHTHAQPHRREHEHHEQRQPATTTITTSTSHHGHEAPTHEDTSTNHSNATSAQRSDQHKHQTSRHRNNREPKTEPRAPQRISPRPTPADRQAFWVLTTCASLEHESITFAHCWEAMNPRNHAENSLFVCCSTHVRNGRKSSLLWGSKPGLDPRPCSRVGPS